MFITRRKNGYYYIVFKREDGKRTTVSTQSKTLTDATKFLMKYQGKNSGQKDYLFKNTSVREFAVEFIRYSEIAHAKLTTRDYENTFRFFLKYFGYTTPLKDITNAQLQKYIRHRIEFSSIYQGRKDLINLKSALARAVEIGTMQINPAKGIRTIKPPERLPLFYREDEFEKLISVTDSQDFKDLIVFAVNTGLRQKELIQLTWRNIDLHSRTLTLDNIGFITKSKRVRSIPLNDEAFSVLQRRKFLPQKMSLPLMEGNSSKIS